MRGVRAAALLPFGVLVVMLIGSPAGSVVIPRWPPLGGVLTDPAMRVGLVRHLALGASGVAIGWPAGFLAAFGIWGGAGWLRWGVLGLGAVLAMLPPLLTATALAGTSPALAPLAAPSAGAALLILTAGLDRLDLGILRSAASCGATPWQCCWLVLWPALGWTPWVAAASGLILSAFTV